MSTHTTSAADSSTQSSSGRLGSDLLRVRAAVHRQARSADVLAEVPQATEGADGDALAEGEGGLGLPPEQPSDDCP
jgi:hypothetical protein